jgi:hypothetical protein
MARWQFIRWDWWPWYFRWGKYPTRPDVTTFKWLAVGPFEVRWLAR